MNISRSLKKNIILLILSFALTVLVCCEAKEINCNNNQDCLYVLPSLWFYFRWILIVIFGFCCIFLGGMALSYSFRDLGDFADFMGALFLYSSLLCVSIFGFKLNAPIWASRPANFFNPIQKVQISIDSLEEYIGNKIVPLIENYESEYDSLYSNLESELRAKNFRKHEKLLAKCNEYKYLATCNLLEKTAIMRHSLNWLNNKYQEIDTQKIKLEQNKWKLEKQQDLNEIASEEEKDEVNQLIKYTETIL